LNDFDTLSGVLASAVATSGTFTTGYPSGGRIGDYRSGKAHKLIVGQKEYSSPNDFGVAYTSATVITITWRAANTLPAGSAFRLQLDRGGGAFVDGRQDRGPPGVNNASYAGVVRVNLGAPITADVDGVAAVQLLGSATDFVLDGAQVVDGVAILDVPRNITLTVATTDHSGKTITVYGTDEYGEELIESRAGPNNNTVALAKAFKTVTRVASSAAIATNGISVGFGDVLGLPVHAPATAILKEVQDGAAAVAGTLVAGLAVNTKSTATTADVRGTYDPNAACDGAKVFELDLVLADPTFLGVSQYAG